jgi:hypothetical protein
MRRPLLLAAVALSLSWIAVDARVGAARPSARLRRLVVLGDSLLAGYSSGGFVEFGRAGQRDSAPALVARRARVKLTQPLMERPGVPPQYRIDDRDGDGELDPGEIVRPLNGLGFRDDPEVVVRNLAVPGESMLSIFDGIRPEDMAEELVSTDSDGRRILKFLVLGLPVRDESVTQVSRALELRPSFLMVWIGNNDVLDMAVRTDPAAVDITAPQFGQLYRELLHRLANAGVDMAVANLPDVTSIPALRRAAGEVTACQGSGGELNPVAPDDLLSIGLDRERLPNPPCTKVLSGAEREQAREIVQSFNAEIAAAAAEVGAARGVTIAVVDMFSRFDQIATTGIDVDGDGVADLGAGFLGGIFSLDGIHPTRTANAVIANAYIDTLNTQFGETIAPVDVARVARRDPHVGNRFRPAGEPPFGLFTEEEIEAPLERAFDRVEAGARHLARDLRRGVRDVADFFDDLF